MKSVLEYKKATINITEEKSIKNINFSIAENEFIFLIGKTGSGKSSILRTMYADKNFSDGDLMIFNFDLKNIKKKEIPFLRRKIGIIFQDFKLLPDRSVFKNLEFVLRAKSPDWTPESVKVSRKTLPAGCNKCFRAEMLIQSSICLQ